MTETREQKPLSTPSPSDVALWLRVTLSKLVDAPNAVDVREVEGSQATILEVSSAPDDIRRIIGRKGRTADALRDLLIGIGGKDGRRYLLEICEPPGSLRSEAIPTAAARWEKPTTTTTIRRKGRMGVRHDD